MRHAPLGRVGTVLLLAVVAASCSSQGPSTRLGTSGTTGATSASSSDQSPVPTTASSGTTTSSVSPPAVPNPPSGATATTLSSSDMTDIASAFESFARIPPSCQVAVVSGSVKAATVLATSTTWAFLRVAPTSTCRISAVDPTADPKTAYPFALPGGDTGIFQRVASGAWSMNYFETVPFPCPPNTALGESPGPGSPIVPLSVLNAVRTSYASSGCQDPYAIHEH